MVELRQMLIWGLLIGLFITSLTSMGLQMSLDNNKGNSSFIQSAKFEVIDASSNTTQSQLTNAQEISEAQEKVQESSSSTTSFGELIIESTPQSALSLKNSSRGNFLAAFEMISSTMSISPIILATFTAILLITFFTLIWSFIRSGR